MFSVYGACSASLFCPGRICKLNKHLEAVDKSALEMYGVLLDRLKRRDGITERLKEENHLEWVRRMNTIRHEAEMAVKGR